MALKRVKIEVTLEDQATARAKCTEANMASWPRECLITTALRRYIPTMRGCGNYAAHLLDMDFDIELPVKAQKAMVAFDASEDVEPFSFHITVPEEVLAHA